MNYKSIAPIETPYQRAKEEWDSRLGSAKKQALNWRYAFFSLFLVSLVIMGVNVYLLMQQRLIPLVVKVHAESGRTEVMGEITNAFYTPNSREVKYFLYEFIRRVRSVPDDAVLIKKNWLEAYMFLRREASIHLNERANESSNNPLKAIGDRTVSIDIISTIKVTESDSYQSRWKERVYDKNGVLLDEYIMSGIFSIEFDKANEKALFINPLGIFIRHFEWNREL